LKTIEDKSISIHRGFGVRTEVSGDRDEKEVEMRTGQGLVVRGQEW